MSAEKAPMGHRERPVSGNIWGWRWSWISLVIIVAGFLFLWLVGPKEEMAAPDAVPAADSTASIQILPVQP